MIEIELAKKPGITCLSVPKSGKYPFPFSVDNLRAIGNINLICGTGGHDLVALNNNGGVLNRIASIAIDESTALDYQGLLPLRGRGDAESCCNQRNTAR